MAESGLATGQLVVPSERVRLNTDIQTLPTDARAIRWANWIRGSSRPRGARARGSPTTSEAYRLFLSPTVSISPASAAEPARFHRPRWAPSKPPERRPPTHLARFPAESNAAGDHFAYAVWRPTRGVRGCESPWPCGALQRHRRGLPRCQLRRQQNTFLNIQGRGGRYWMPPPLLCVRCSARDPGISYRRTTVSTIVEVALSDRRERMVRSDLAAAGVILHARH